jgi:hypothetical protein
MPCDLMQCETADAGVPRVCLHDILPILGFCFKQVIRGLPPSRTIEQRHALGSCCVRFDASERAQMDP